MAHFHIRNILTALKNTSNAFQPQLRYPYINKKVLILLRILYNQGYIAGFNNNRFSSNKVVNKSRNQNQILISLKINSHIYFKHLKFYDPKLKSSYLKKEELQKLIRLKGCTFGLLSTSKGLLTLDEALAQKVGGLLIFTV